MGNTWRTRLQDNLWRLLCCGGIRRTKRDLTEVLLEWEEDAWAASSYQSQDFTHPCHTSTEATSPSPILAAPAGTPLEGPPRVPAMLQRGIMKQQAIQLRRRLEAERQALELQPPSFSSLVQSAVCNPFTPEERYFLAAKYRIDTNPRKELRDMRRTNQLRGLSGEALLFHVHFGSHFELGSTNNSLVWFPVSRPQPIDADTLV
ncbi:hypothetical protein BSKO_05587 [Bryopsis sp. KO-2023]|nr:hypothetical protein BSKO_05587 [Bryopsis sp. KO-2023]